MITVITGLTGSGKTWLMSRLAYKRWKEGDKIHANLSFNFPKENIGVYRWHDLSELYSLTNGVICIDEGQKLFAARNWAFLPVYFADQIASHRHQGLDIITTTQDFGHIDLIVRNNVHELYNCQSIFRFPKNDRKKPILQLIKIIKKRRSLDDSIGIKWTKTKVRFVTISRYFTKELYNTYANINLSHFLCHVFREKGKWKIVLQSRQLAGRRQQQ